MIRLAFVKGNYGCLDPFLIGKDGQLFTRADDHAAWIAATRQTAKSIIADGRKGVPVLEFSRSFAGEWQQKRAAADEVLKEAASWYYDVAELYEDPDLDPDDSLEVVKRAFTSSDCDDFAAVLSEMTGWETVRASWSIPDWGFGHHTLVRHPRGGLIDVHGWSNELTLCQRYGIKGPLRIEAALPCPQTLNQDIDDLGIDESKRRIAAVIRALPYDPFIDKELRPLLKRPLPGADSPGVPESSARSSAKL